MFTHLCSTLPRALVIDDEVNTRLEKVSATIGRLRKSVLDRRGIIIQTLIYKSLALTTLLHGCKTRTVFQRHATELQPSTPPDKTFWHKVPRQDIRHKNLHSCQSSHCLYHLDADPAALGRPCSSHASLSTPQEGPLS